MACNAGFRVKKKKFMTIEQLHTITSEDWARIESQFSEKYRSVITFVTENKGTLAEGRDIYIEAFIYYIQLLELHGMEMAKKADQIIYSFARKLWLSKLSKRNVDTDFVKHRREFFEMEDAFHDIDSINERSKKTSEKLAELGEPARTLITEHIGKQVTLEDLYSRLGITSEERSFSILAKSLRKLIKLTERKDFDSIDDDSFERLVRYVMDNPNTEFAHRSNEDKVCLTMIARCAAMIRNYSERKNRQSRLDELKVRFEPGADQVLKGDGETQKHLRMKPVLIFGLTAVIAVVISTITAFGILAKSTNDGTDVALDLQDTVITPEPQVEAYVETEPRTAFLIDDAGFLITTADLNGHTSLVKLRNSQLDQNYSAQVVFIDTTLNLAVLKCDSLVNARIPYRFSSEDPRVGQPLFTVGIKNGDVLYEEGYLNSSHQDGYGRSEFKSVPDGSPVLSDRGQVLGVVVHNDPDHIELSKLVKNSELVKVFESLAQAKGMEINLPQRNKLYYSDRADQIEKITPFVFDVENPAPISETIASTMP